MRVFMTVVLCLLCAGYATAQASEVSKTLIEFLRGDDEEAAHAAATLLARLGESVIPAVAPLVVESDDRTHARAIGVMVAIGMPAVPALREALRKGPRWGKSDIARALVGVLGEDLGDLPVVIAQQLNDRDPGVRMELCNVLAELHERAAPARDRLIACLHDTEPHLRHCACSALGYLHAEGVAALPALFQRLHDDEPEVRWFAAEAVGSIGSQSEQARGTIAKQLITLLDDSDGRVRDMALDSLSQLGPAASAQVERIARKLSDPAGFVRLRAAFTLQAIGDLDGEPVLNALTHCLDDSDAFVAATAAGILGHVGTPTDFVVAALVRALDSSDPRVRANAANSLGQLHAPQPTARAALERRLHDSDAWARLNIVNALRLLGT
jgi:HEAT repeat protein